jgi:hypothetical protein
MRPDAQLRWSLAKTLTPVPSTAPSSSTLRRRRDGYGQWVSDIEIDDLGSKESGIISNRHVKRIAEAIADVLAYRGVGA